MEKTSEKYRAYIRILEKELIPAMGCTEPIAIAYVSAYAKRWMGNDAIQQVDIHASGNMIKNVKSVIVPNTNGRKGIIAAAAIGIVAGDPDKELEVIAEVSEDAPRKLEQFLREVPIHVHHACSDCALVVRVILIGKKHRVEVMVKHMHTHIVYVKVDDEVLLDLSNKQYRTEDKDYATLSMKEIYDFATSVDVADIHEIIERQIRYNSAIAEEGLKNTYGANIGSVILKAYGDRVQIRAKAMAAAGSDARMSGCELPVIINSGSGNQGMCASLPVIEYAKEHKVSEETLYRALVLSNLSTLYQKIYIGRLSAYCGAVSAGAGAGAGIAYVLGGDFDSVAHTIVNALAITSGIICDGAKASCAAKIASAVDAGILGCEMYAQGKQFYHGDGIVGKSIEDTILCVGKLAKDGMRYTDDEIIAMMMAS